MPSISKDFGFSAGHALAGLPEGHQCARPHGHNYLVRVSLEAPDLDRTGFVLDYGALDPFAEFLKLSLDHRWLGYGPVEALGTRWAPVVDFNPTAELLAAWLATWLVEATVIPPLDGMILRVGVSETAKTWAWA